MRVSNSLLFNNLMRDIRKYQSRMEELRENISTAKRVRKPSDDPLAAARGVSIRARLARAQQHEQNIEDARGWISATELALINAKDILLKARDIALRGANDTVSAEARSDLAREVEELYEELFMIVNTKHEDVYIFSGFRTDTQPFQVEGGVVVYNGDDGLRKIEAEPGLDSRIEVNVPGNAVFGPDGANIFGVLTGLVEHLREGDAAAISQDDIEKIDERLNAILNRVAELGIRASRLDRAKERVLQDQVRLASLLSKAEDADVAKDAMTLALQEGIYKTALAATARMVQPTLVDFLR